MAKHKFRLLTDGHRHGPVGDEETLKAGAIIHSDKPLDEMFANKFERLSGPKAKKKDEEVTEYDEEGTKSALEASVDVQEYADELNAAAEEEAEEEPKPKKKGDKPKVAAKPKKADPDLEEDDEEEEDEEEAEDEPKPKKKAVVEDDEEPKPKKKVPVNPPGTTAKKKSR